MARGIIAHTEQKLRSFSKASCLCYRAQNAPFSSFFIVQKTLHTPP